MITFKVDYILKEFIVESFECEVHEETYCTRHMTFDVIKMNRL